VLARIVKGYSERRYHSAPDYLPPKGYYRGNPAAHFEERRRKLAEARHKRRELNLRLKQRTLPLEEGKPVAND